MTTIEENITARRGFAQTSRHVRAALPSATVKGSERWIDIRGPSLFAKPKKKEGSNTASPIVTDSNARRRQTMAAAQHAFTGIACLGACSRGHP